jgi:DNA (cytosine-5)-methyltransferase 1
MKIFQIADLFCGAGGTSTGAIEAVEGLGYRARLTAVNHWPVAVETHALNHPEARHLCASLDSINPRDLYAPGELDLLWASPECTHHSVARGGKPINDQSRATAWCVVRWAEALQPDVVLVENVPEFITWGGIGSDGRPLKSQRGRTFAAWLAALESLGYRVEWRLLCAADYGDPTTRRRLFVQAVRGKRRVVWPEPTHAPVADHKELWESSRRPWVAAREIIDWQLPGESIYDREANGKRPLSPKTLERIRVGLQRFGLNPSLVCMEHKGSVRSVAEPVPTITTARCGAMGIATPFLVELRGTEPRQIESTARSVDQPLPTVTAGGGHMGLCDPFLVPNFGERAGQAPRARSVDAPLPTVTGHGAGCLVEPFLVSYYGTGGAKSVGDPLDTVTARDRFGLVRPVVEVQGERYLLDIRFRMLQPHELAAAQGFPTGYQFAGNKTEIVKQIGNAVPRRLARAIVRAVVGQGGREKDEGGRMKAEIGGRK